MPCSCHEASEETKKYHEIRGFCEDQKKSGLTEIVNYEIYKKNYD